MNIKTRIVRKVMSQNKRYEDKMRYIMKIHPLVEQLNLEIYRAWKDGINLTVNVTENDKLYGEATVISVEAFSNEGNINCNAE